MSVLNTEEPEQPPQMYVTYLCGEHHPPRVIFEQWDEAAKRDGYLPIDMPVVCPVVSKAFGVTFLQVIGPVMKAESE